MKLFGLPVEEMKTFLQQSKGLMFRRKFRSALVFDMKYESRLNSSIHSLFVFLPFDVLFLDAKKKIVDMKTVNPWTLILIPKKPARYIVELPKGTIKKRKLKIGQAVAL